MSRLRRSHRHSDRYPVAAEVLEVRALLSSTVHAAIAQAQHAVHAASNPATATHFAGPIIANTFVEELADFGFEIGGKISKGSVGLTAGQVFSASFQIKPPSTAVLPFKSVSGKLGGTVNSVTPLGGKTVFDITPSGIIKASGILDGHHFTVKLAPKPGEHSTLKLNSDNSLSQYLTIYVLPNAGKFHGGDVNIVLFGDPS